MAIAPKGPPASSAPTGAAPKTPAPAQDPLSLLTGDQRNAYSAVLAVFTQYGLASLAPTILKYVQQGFGSDTVSLLLQDTPEFKQRFSANDARLKAGLPVLSPGQYLSAEESYRNIMQAAGLPSGFYDQTSDFTNFLTKDVSPTELQSRVNIAQDYLYAAPQETKDQLLNYYGIDQGHALAHILDPAAAAPLIQKQYAASQLGGIAAQNNVDVSRTQAEGLLGQGVTTSQAQSGFSALGQVQPDLEAAAKRAGVDYSKDDEVNDFVGGLASAKRKREQIAQTEAAQFAGSGRVGYTGANTGAAGNF